MKSAFFFRQLVPVKPFLCTLCNKAVKEGIFGSRFYPNLFAVLSAFFVLGALVAILARISLGSGKRNIDYSIRSPVPLITAATVLGIGLGGFVDGIVLHQVLQWHEMLSSKIPATDYVGKSINMFWDGIFHLFCLFVTFSGCVLLWRLAKRNDVDTSGRLLTGGLLIGWAIFNFVEGIIDHHLLKLHNVLESSKDPDVANFTFLGLSALLLLAGLWLTLKENWLAAVCQNKVKKFSDKDDMN
jgi:uncharacterized membrane protein